jgi:hypothetical protein
MIISLRTLSEHLELERIARPIRRTEASSPGLNIILGSKVNMIGDHAPRVEEEQDEEERASRLLSPRARTPGRRRGASPSTGPRASTP